MIELAFLAAGASLIAYIAGSLSNRQVLFRVGTAMHACTSVILLLTLLLRGILSGHWPLGSQYEFTLAFAWIVTVIYLLTRRSGSERRGGAGVAAIIFVLLLRAVTAPAEIRAMGPLPPVLRSWWLQAHVVTVLVGYGCVSVAAGLAMASLAAGKSHTVATDRVRRLVEVGFPFLSLGILGGAMWAHYAWGRYWGWDPKETWSLVTWLWYLAMLHWPSRRSTNRGYAWCALIGLALVLFTFVGVPALANWQSLDTLHGY